VNSWIVRLCNAAVMLCVSIGSASAARPAPQYADVVITYAGQTFGFAGPLRAFAASESGGRISLDLTTLSTPGYAPRPDIGGVDLGAPGNRWQLVGFGGHAPLTITGTCAVESFATVVDGVVVQNVYLNCVDLDVSG